ncbi:myb-like protein V, partial [Frankliniella occidentalis]|uniref:Myb-like protein V n=1 Tax=Frankliniella occidentalis TaxID=133901 RepID=A0A9C6XVQ7_FRAOC
MKEGYAVVRFKDTKVAKIAHLSIVRNVDKSPFDPKSCKDFIIGDDVQVKWQQSLTEGSLQDDGFYDAQIFAIAPSVVTAEKKAKELRIKLPQCSLISIEAKSTPLPTQNVEKQSSRRKQGSRSENSDSMLKQRSKHRHSKLEVTKEKGNGEKHSATKRNAEKDHTENLGDESVSKKHDEIDINESDISDSDELKDKGKSKKKTNLIAKDPISLKRLKAVIDDSLKTNPLFQNVDSSGTDCELSKNGMSSKIKPMEIVKKSNSQEKNGADNPSKRSKKEKDQDGNQEGDFDGNDIYEKAEEGKSGKLGNHDATNPFSCSGQIETDDSVKASKVLSGFNSEGMPSHSTPSKSMPMVEAKNSSEKPLSPVMKAGFQVTPLKEDSFKSPLSSGHKSLVLSELKRKNESPVLTTPSKKIKKDKFKVTSFNISSASKQTKSHIQNLFKGDSHDEFEDTLRMGSGSDSDISLFHDSDSGSEDDTVKLMEKIRSLQESVGKKKREVKDLRRDLSAAVKLIDQLKLKIDQLEQSMSKDCEQNAESSNEHKKTNQRKGSPKTSKVVNKKKSIK